MAIIGGGQVLVHAPPRKIVQAVKGKIWTKEIDRNDLEICKEKLAVIATHINQGRMRIHVIGNTAPDASFDPGAANMEDAYFAVISGYTNVAEQFPGVPEGQL
jgi:hypothetical protein